MTQTDALPDDAIAIRGLRKTYAASKKAAPKTALDGVDLTIPRGSIFGLLGPNGAGKSTLINILAGVVNKSEGEVLIWGRDIDKRPRDARATRGNRGRARQAKCAQREPRKHAVANLLVPADKNHERARAE